MRVKISMKTVYSFRIQGTMHICKLNFMFTFSLATSVDKKNVAACSLIRAKDWSFNEGK